MKTLTTFISNVKRDVMFHVINNMRKNELTMGTAQDLAREFLDLVPAQSEREIVKQLHILGQIYKEVRAVFIKYANVLSEQEKNAILNIVPPYIKQNNLEYATQVIKGGTQSWLN